MVTMYKAKVLVLGPCQVGKSVISNFLSDATESSDDSYHPTQGCRILEFEVPNIVVTNRKVTAEIELWDIGGDQKFEGCWPAIARDVSGVIFVFNPEKINSDKQLESWYTYFVEHQGLRDAQCVAFAHHKSGTPSNEPMKLGGEMRNVRVVNTNLEQGDMLRDDFSVYLAEMLNALYDKREEEETSILNA